jgi:competence protein ComEC
MQNVRLKYVCAVILRWGILAAQESVWPMQHLTTGAVQAEVEITATDGATQHQGKIVPSMASAGGPPPA